MTKSADPITPYELLSRPRKPPADVVRVWNDLIRQNWDDEAESVVRTEEAVLALVPLAAAIVGESDGNPDSARMQRELVFNSRWLDVEPMFRGAGWLVVREADRFTFSLIPKRRADDR